MVSRRTPRQGRVGDRQYLAKTAAYIILLALSSLAFPAFSAEESLDQLLDLSLDELASYQVVTATKTSLRLADSPGTITVITRRQIEMSAADTIPELLRNQAGVNVRWNPMAQTVDVRSFGSNPFTNRVLLLIDGIPYNSWNKGGFPQHPGFDFFNLDIVKHIEVLRGSGSSLYGENALNGVINIITLDGTEGVANRLKYSSGSMQGETISASYNHSFNDKRSVFAALRYQEGQLPTELWFDESDADATGYDLYLKSQFERLNFLYYRRQDKFEGFSHEVGGGFPPGTVFRSADEIRQSVNIAAIRYKQPVDQLDGELSANVSFANRNGSHCAACHARTEREEFSSSEDHGYQLFANLQLDSRKIENHEVTVGAEWREISSGEHSHELLGAGVNTTATSSHEPILKYRKHAIFIQDQHAALDNRLKTTLGLRYESGTSPSLFRDQWFPRVSVVYQIDDRTTLKGGWHRAARYPSFSELYQDSGFLTAETPFGDIPLADFIPNADLKPERIESIEFGLSYRWGPELHGHLQVFRNLLQDPMILAYPLIRFENHPADAEIKGAEFTLQAQPWEWLDARFAWSWQTQRQIGGGVDSTGNALEFTYAPKHKINLGLSATPNDHLDINLEVNWKSETFAPTFWYGIAFGNPERVALDSFAYVNARVSYRLPWLQQVQHRPLTLSMSLKNLTNEKPYETLTGYGGRSAGRTGFLSLEYRWANK